MSQKDSQPYLERPKAGILTTWVVHPLLESRTLEFMFTIRAQGNIEVFSPIGTWRWTTIQSWNITTLIQFLGVKATCVQLGSKFVHCQHGGWGVHFQNDPWNITLKDDSVLDFEPNLALRALDTEKRKAIKTMDFIVKDGPKRTELRWCDVLDELGCALIGRQCEIGFIGVLMMKIAAHQSDRKWIFLFDMQ